MHPILLIIGLIAAYLCWSWIKQAPKAKQKQLRNRALLIAGAAILLVGLLSGRLHPMFAALGAAIPLIIRVVSMLQQVRANRTLFGDDARAGEPSAGRRSKVETRFLRMWLDHDSGDMNGEVLVGQFKGRQVSALSQAELFALYQECAPVDDQSRAVLEAYLDREQDGWRDHVDTSSRQRNVSRSDGTMDRQEAAEVLGVSVSASRAEIVDAHRRLMQRLHPDRGGSDYLAAKINTAKDLLLKG